MCMMANESDLLAVERFAIEQGCVTSRQVSARINKSVRVSQHLLKTLGETKRLARIGTVREGGRQRLSVWALPGYEELSEATRMALEEADEAKQNLPGDGLPLVLHRAANEWRRGASARHPMDVALFGPAPAKAAA